MVLLLRGSPRVLFANSECEENGTPPLAFLLVVNIEVLQYCGGARESLFIVAMRHGDAGDEHGDIPGKSFSSGLAKSMIAS